MTGEFAAAGYPLAQLMERFPDLRKAEFVVACDPPSTLSVPPQVEGLSARCRTVHAYGFDGVIHFVELPEGLWRPLGCDVGCTPIQAWEAAEVIDQRQPGEDDGAAPSATRLWDEGVADFFATAAPEIQWLLEPYVPKGGFVLVQGGPKSGKTWFGAWLAAECAGKGFRVAFVEEEGAREVLRDRLQPFVAGRAAALNATLRVLYRARIRLDNPAVLAELAELYKGYDLIVLDPFIRLHGKKEQAADEMALVLGFLHELMHLTGAAVVLIHHTKKNGSWDRGSSADAGLDDGRGSGVTAGEADNVIAIKGVPPKERQAGQVRFIVENPGSRLGPEFERVTAVVDLTQGAAAPMTFLSKDEVVPDSDLDDPIEAVIELIMRTKSLPSLESEAISGSAITRTLNINKKYGLKAVSRCVNVGILECCEGRSGPLYFKPESAE